MTSLLLPVCLLALTQIVHYSAATPALGVWTENPATGKEYLVLNTSTLEIEAVTSLCAEHDAILPEPRSEEDNIFLNSLDTDLFVLGMNDNETEGSWVWNSDGTPVIYTNWQRAEGRDGVKENCAFLGRQWGLDHRAQIDHWHDFPCQSSRYFDRQAKNLVCQREMHKSQLKLPVHCPDGWTRWNNLCLKELDRDNYRGAKAQCIEAGGSHLLGPSYDKEVLKELGIKNHQNVWLHSDEDKCTFLRFKTGDVIVTGRCNKNCQVVCVKE